MPRGGVIFCLTRYKCAGNKWQGFSVLTSFLRRSAEAKKVFTFFMDPSSETNQPKNLREVNLLFAMIFAQIKRRRLHKMGEVNLAYVCHTSFFSYPRVITGDKRLIRNSYSMRKCEETKTDSRDC